MSDQKAIERILEKEPKLVRFFEKHDRKLDLDSFRKDPFPAVVAAVIGQKIAYTKARKMRSELYAMLSSAQSFTPAEIIQLDDSKLLSTGMPRTVLRRIRQVAQQFQRDPNIDVREILSIHGIGKWTLATTKLTINPRLDLFPYADYFIRKKIRTEFQLSAMPSIAAMREMSDGWSPDRGIIAWYIWRDL